MQPGVADRMPEARSGRDAGRVLRLLALIAVAIGLAAITAAACVLSYSSIHHLATLASVSPRLARLYPLIFDALLVLAGCSVLALRGAGLVSRVYSWLCLLALLGALAGGGAVRAAAIKVPHRLAGILAAVIPWALVLIGFGLLLALLRYARIRRLGQLLAEPELEPGHGAEPAELVVMKKTTAPQDRIAGPAAIVPGFARTPAAPMPGPPGVLPAVTRTGGSPEAPTAPQPVAHFPTTPIQEAPVQAPLVQAAPGQPAPGQPAPVETARPAHAAVRQADLQLKARVPRQPAGQQAQASPVTARHAPFMPSVGLRPADETAPPGEAAKADEVAQLAEAARADEVARPGETAQADEAARSGDTGTGEAARTGETDRAGETGRTGQAAVASAATSAGPSGSTQQTNPRLLAGQSAGADGTADTVTPANVTPANAAPANAAPANAAPADVTPANATSASETAANEPTASTSLNAAPVIDDEDEDEEPGAPPALRRPRSSPTPPED